MKRYAIVVSLALLFAAFMWSCQQQDSAPLSPEESITLGKKPGGKGPATTYKIEVFFDNPDPALPDISVATRAKAGATFGGTGVGAPRKDKTTILALTPALAQHFLDLLNASGRDKECFSAFFDEFGDPKQDTPIVGLLSVIERDDPFDAVGSFWTDDKVDPILRISMWGVILADDLDLNVNPQGEGIWSLPGPDDKLVVTSNTIFIEDPPPGGPDRLGITVETGTGKDKDVCKQGVENQPWRIVITLNP